MGDDGRLRGGEPAGTETERIIGTQMPHAVPRTKASEAPSAQYDGSGAVTQQLSHAITVTTVSAAPTRDARRRVEAGAHARRRAPALDEERPLPEEERARPRAEPPEGDEQRRERVGARRGPRTMPTTKSVACSATRTARPIRAERDAARLSAGALGGGDVVPVHLVVSL